MFIKVQNGDYVINTQMIVSIDFTDGDYWTVNMVNGEAYTIDEPEDQAQILTAIGMSSVPSLAA